MNPDAITAATLARSMPLGLARYVDPDFEVTPLAKLENDLWLDTANGVIDRVLVVAPPQFGKTTLSEYALAWLIGNNPWMKLMVGKYGLELAKETGRKVRDVLEDHGADLFGVEVRDDTTKSTDWKTTAGGGMFSGGRRGGFTGRGAHGIYGDDFFKDAKEGESPTVQDEARRFLDITLGTRLREGGFVFLTNTRWAEDDTVGHIRRRQWPRWSTGKGRAVRVPAIADGLDFDGKNPAPDPCGRPTGESLWPRMFPISLLEDRRTTQGPIMFNTIYQGIPSPAEGLLFKRSDFRYWEWANEERNRFRLVHGSGSIEVAYSDCQVAAFMDLAATDKPEPGEDPDYTVASIWAFTPTGNMLLLDVIRERVDTTQHEAIYDSIRRRYRCNVHVEEAFVGLNLVQSLKRRGRPIIPVYADRNKISRARALQAKYAIHAVYHPDPQGVPEAMRWIADWEDEVLSFPRGKHDDQVDTGAYAAAYDATWSEPHIYVDED